MRNILEVKNGVIYNNILGDEIHSMGIVVDKRVGLLKYGEKDKVKLYFDNMMNSYHHVGLIELVKDIIFVSFDKYKNLLINEVCTLVNYLYMVSANEKRTMELLTMDEGKLKIELKKLEKIGF